MTELSIISIFSDIRETEITYQSLKKQNQDYFEWIVVDINSVSRFNYDDRWIKYYNIPQFTNEIDLINQAINFSKGKYVMILNMGTSFDAKFSINSLELPKRETDFIWGNIISTSSDYQYHYPQRDDFSMFYLIEHPIPLQSTLIKRSTFEKYSGFDINNSIAFDFDFFLRTIVSSQCTVRFVPELSMYANPFSFEKHVNRTTEILNTIVNRYPRLIGEDNPRLRLPSEIHSAMCFWRFLQNNTMINLLYNVCIKPFIRKNK